LKKQEADFQNLSSSRLLNILKKMNFIWLYTVKWTMTLFCSLKKGVLILEMLTQRFSI